MGIADWWVHHCGQSASTMAVVAQGRVFEIDSSTCSQPERERDGGDDDASGDEWGVNEWQVAGSRKMKRSKSERMGVNARQKKRQTHPAFRVHGPSQVATKGLFQQAFVAKFFPRMKRFQIRRPESPLEESPLKAREIVAADGGDTRRRSGSRFRTLFSRSAAAPVQQEGVKVPDTAVFPLEWLSSETSVRFEEEARSLLSNGAGQFQITSEGCGGAYFLQDQSSSRSKSMPLGIFKPRDEEYMAPKNPRGYVKENAVVGETEHPVNKGFRVGNGALRERAAYVLDEVYGSFSGVPATGVMTLTVHGEEKEGSMQRFVPSECSAEDMGTLKFAIPEVHKIGILDVRLFNTDRHAGNILLGSRPDEQTYSMTPIDHGFCLPSYKYLDSATFDWLYWPQAQFPFTCAELEHIASLNVSRDASMLRSLGIEEECIATMRISTTFLKIGAEAGFSLFEIASCLQREGDFSSPSQLEDLVAIAVAVVEQQTGLSEQINGGEVEFLDALIAEVERAATAMFEDQPKKKVRSISCFS
jgi:hypothetical protein